MLTRVALLLVCLAITGTAPVAAQKPSANAAAESIYLQFGWEPGLKAQVTGVQSWESSGEAVGENVALYLSYEMTVGKHEDGLVIEYPRSQLDSLVSVPPLEPDNFLRRILEETSNIKYGMVVSELGDLVGVHGAAETSEALERALKPVFDTLRASGHPNAEQLAETLGNPTRPEQMEASTLEFWNGLVGTWPDADLDVGAVYQLETEEPSPMFPGLMIPMTVELGLVERTPCHADDHSVSCVLLELSSYPDPEALAEVMNKFMEGIGGADSGLHFSPESMDQTSRILVVTEPGTLIPHRYTTTRSFSIVSKIGDEEVSMARKDITDLTFHYPGR